MIRVKSAKKQGLFQFLHEGVSDKIMNNEAYQKTIVIKIMCSVKKIDVMGFFSAIILAPTFLGKPYKAIL